MRHRTMKMYWRVEVQLHAPVVFPPERSPWYLLNMSRIRRIESNPDFPAIQLIA
jgi:hypothetical protein